MKINDNGVDRDMTEAEQAKYEAWAAIAQAEAATQAEAEAATLAARASALAKLAELGLTPDEIAALVGA
jgi:tryptophanyl-tRNA synthetase